MKTLPRVMHLRASNFFGGPERQVLRYAALESVDTYIGSYVGDGSGTEFLSHARKFGLPTLELPVGKKALLDGIRKTRDFLRDQNIDLLCTHDYRSDVIGWRISRNCGIPWVPFLRGWTGENRRIRVFEALDRRVLKYASLVVCLSETHAAEMRLRGRLEKKVRVVPNVIDVPASVNKHTAKETLCDRLGLNPEAPIVASAGRLSPEKGVQIFLRAIGAVVRRHPATQFVIFGDGGERSALERQARTIPGNRIVFAGHRRDFSELLPGVDILVNASYAEQMPNVVLEAMAARVPVVATSAGAVAEMAGDPAVIHLTKVGDWQLIADEVSNLLEHPEIADEISRRAVDRLRDSFSPKRQHQRLASVYHELIPELEEQPSRANGEMPMVSVVIPVRNEAKNISGVLEALLRQDYPRDKVEIIVADGNSTDATRQTVEQYAGQRVRYVANPAQLSSAGRNVGIRTSRGDVIVFVDGHCEIPSKSLLFDSVEMLKNAGASCLARPQPLTVRHATGMQRLIAAARGHMLGHGADSTIYNTSFEGFVDPTSSGATYRREVFSIVGEYDETFDACEDVEFNHRVKKAGLKCWISPRLTIYYHPRRNLTGLFHQMVRYGRGRCRLARKHVDAMSFSQLIPSFFVAGLILGTLGSLLWSPFRVFFLFGIAIYFAALLIASGTLVRKAGVLAVLAPAVFFTIHSGLGIGFLRELMARERATGIREQTPLASSNARERS